MEHNQVVSHRTLHLTVEGDWLTQSVREIFWEKGRTYEHMENTLLDGIVSDTLTHEEKVRMVKDILLGRSKLTGNSGSTEGIQFEDDDYTCVFNAVAKMRQENENLRNRIKKLEKVLERHDIYEDDVESIYAGSPLLHSFMEARHHEDNYGWLEPSGAFHPVEWGEHQEWAYDEITRKGWNEDFRKLEQNAAAGDYLTEIRGWVLMHNPAQGLAIPTYSRPMTKAQRDFLYGYYADRGRDDFAERYLNE